MDIPEFMLLTRKEYNTLRERRVALGLSHASWFLPEDVGTSREDPGTLGFKK